MLDTAHSPAPAIRKISTSDVWQSLRQGFSDFEAYRSDVLFLCATYAVIGLVLARIAFGSDLLPLLFPLASGFAILGPLAAVGLYEMSRRREQGADAGWANAFDVIKAPAIAAMGAILVATFLLWLATAWVIFQFTLAPTLPHAPSLSVFAHAVLFTPPGQKMILVGMSVGFVFALVAMMISVVSFPLLLDRDTGLDTAIGTSVRAVLANPVPMALWGLVVAGGLLIGTSLAFVGLMVVVPVLGHATWHLYRKLIG
jgi:uncharacterized membrane protein